MVTDGSGGWLLYLRIREWQAGQGSRGPSSEYPRLTSSSRVPLVSLLSPASVVTSQNADYLVEAWGDSDQGPLFYTLLKRESASELWSCQHFY